MTAKFLSADRPDGRIFACIAAVNFVKAEVATTKLGASLKPFADHDCAIAALLDAGGSNIRIIG